MRTADPNAPTKENILHAAQKLMLAKGFTATSIDEICTEAQATKGSFFHFFENKEALGKAVLERFVCGQLAWFESAPFQKIEDPVARLLGWIDATINAFNDPSMPKSCMLGNFSQELAPTNPEIQSLCAQWFSRSSEGFARDAAAAAEKFPPAAPFDPKDLADLFLTIIQGSLILIKAKKDISIGVKNLRHFRSYVESIFAPVGGMSSRRARR